MALSSLFEAVFEVAQGLEARPLELVDPAVVDLLERHRVEEVQLLAAAPLHGHQVRGFEDRQVLGDALAGDLEMPAQLAERLPVVGVQPVEQLAPSRVGEGLEQEIGVAHGRMYMQVLTCMSRRTSEGH